MLRHIYFLPLVLLLHSCLSDNETQGETQDDTLPVDTIESQKTDWLAQLQQETQNYPELWSAESLTVDSLKVISTSPFDSASINHLGITSTSDSACLQAQYRFSQEPLAQDTDSARILQSYGRFVSLREACKTYATRFAKRHDLYNQYAFYEESENFFGSDSVFYSYHHRYGYPWGSMVRSTLIRHHASKKMPEYAASMPANYAWCLRETPNSPKIVIDSLGVLTECSYWNHEIADFPMFGFVLTKVLWGVEPIDSF